MNSGLSINICISHAKYQVSPIHYKNHINESKALFALQVNYAVANGILPPDQKCGHNC